MVVENLSEMIKNYRNENNLKQKEFGALIGKSQESVSQMERGVHYPRSAEDFNRLAEVLGRPVSEIIDSVHAMRYGIIKEYETELIDLKRMTADEFSQKYKIMNGDTEVSAETLKEIISFYLRNTNDMRVFKNIFNLITGYGDLRGLEKLVKSVRENQGAIELTDKDLQLSYDGQEIDDELRQKILKLIEFENFAKNDI